MKISYFEGLDLSDKKTDSLIEEIDPDDVEEIQSEIEAMTRDDIFDLAPLRKIKLRGIHFAEQYAAKKGIQISQVFHNVHDFLQWKKIESKKLKKQQKSVSNKKIEKKKVRFEIFLTNF